MDKLDSGISFEKFYEKFYSRAVMYTYKRTQNYSEAEEVVCDTFLYCYENYSAYDQQKASLGTWLYLVLNSRLKNWYRDRKESVGLDTIEQWIGDEDHFQKACEIGEMRRILAAALNDLPENYRKVVTLRYFYGYNTGETAKTMDISEANVRVMLNRALKKMKCYYDKTGMGKD